MLRPTVVPFRAKGVRTEVRESICGRVAYLVPAKERYWEIVVPGAGSVEQAQEVVIETLRVLATK